MAYLASYAHVKKRRGMKTRLSKDIAFWGLLEVE